MYADLVRMEVLEDSGGAQRDIKELFNCKSGIESAKSTERRVSRAGCLWCALKRNYCTTTEIHSQAA